MTKPLERLLRRRVFRGEVRRALNSGVGIYRTAWPIEPAEGSDGGARLASDIVGWCREALTRMRRPYGLDHVTLAVSVLSEGDRPIATTSYGVLRPVDFYGAGSAEAQIEETLSRWAASAVISQNPSARLSAVLFSWGDLARELLATG